MATYTGSHRTFSRRFVLPAAAAALAVAAVAGAGAWRVTHSGTAKSVLAPVAQVQQARQSAVQAAAVPAPLGRLSGGPALDNSLVLVGSASQAASTQQAIDQADAIRAELGLAPLHASVVVSPSDQQGIDAANAIRAAMGVPPLAAAGESYASRIQDENTLRASLGLAPIALVDLR
ncbi:MAG TPA: hypothetical protein VFA70_11935 [Dehalococcoidia bacterium]|nr:hypothetical protein [Dehalococcoidia bacterium]